MTTAIRGTAISVMTRLRRETNEQHRATEAIPYSQGLLAGSVPLHRYVDQLRALYIVHKALEEALAGSNHPIVSAVWHEGLAKRRLLEEDLAFFSDAQLVEDLGAARAARRFAERILAVGRYDPVSMLGYLYVLEGSTLGGTVLRRHIARTFELNADGGLAYFSAYGRDVRRHWQNFKGRMEHAVRSPRDQDRIVNAAREGFKHVGAILGALSSGLPPHLPN